MTSTGTGRQPFFSDADRDARAEFSGKPDVYVHTDVIAEELLRRLKESYRRGDAEVTAILGGYYKSVFEDFVKSGPRNLSGFAARDFELWAIYIEERARELSGLGPELTVIYRYESVTRPPSGSGRGSELGGVDESREFLMKLQQ